MRRITIWFWRNYISISKINNNYFQKDIIIVNSKRSTSFFITYRKEVYYDTETEYQKQKKSEKKGV